MEVFGDFKWQPQNGGGVQPSQQPWLWWWWKFRTRQGRWRRRTYQHLVVHATMYLSTFVPLLSATRETTVVVVDGCNGRQLLFRRLSLSIFDLSLSNHVLSFTPSIYIFASQILLVPHHPRIDIGFRWLWLPCFNVSTEREVGNQNIP